MQCRLLIHAYVGAFLLMYLDFHKCGGEWYLSRIPTFDVEKVQGWCTVPSSLGIAAGMHML